MFEVLDVEGREAQEKYHVGLLSGKLIAASSLTDAQIQELLNHDMRLSTSKAVCVLKACARILEARKNHEKVFVSGDYDADGITATAIMKATLDELHIANGYYIPDRFKEGYGLKPDVVQMAHEKGYSLIITVDNGVKAHDALKQAIAYNMDVIVTDHHVIDEAVESDIVVHPQYMEPEYEYLCGAGVALEISRSLIGNRDNLNALAGVASIGDSMPLWRETRKLVLNAIDQLKRGKPPSLAALIYPGAFIDESTIAYSIVPKLNAISRMSDMANVNTAVPFLLSRDGGQINHYAGQLNHVNDMRKKYSDQEARDALERVNSDPFQIIYNPSYHIGICGITAARVSEETHRPTLVLTEEKDVIRGSGRSVEGFDLFDFLSDIDGKKEFGGHAMACGITIHKSEFSNFCHNVHVKIAGSDYQLRSTRKKSVLIQPSDVTFDNIIDLERLSPFPREMFQPVFTVRNPEITGCHRASSVVRYEISNGTSSFEACIFKRKNIPTPAMPIELTGRLTLRRYRGRICLRMMVDDAK